MTPINLALTAVMSLPFCSMLAADPTPTVPAIQKLIISPATIHLGNARASQQLILTGQSANGLEYDVTNHATFESADGKIANVDAAGVVRPRGAGKTVVRTRFQVQVAEIEVVVGDLTKPPPVSFVNEVMAVLGKAGCNTGACHGHASGKGGFKLSLRGYSPGADHRALVREQMGRRVNLIAPEVSLVLQKPSGKLPHGGGRRFAEDSESYHLLRQWLNEGAHEDFGAAARLERIEVSPDYRIVPRPGLSQQLIVRAHYAGGQVRDVTDRAIYELTSDETAVVNAKGTVSTKAAGEATVLIRFQGKMAISRLIVIEARPGFSWSNPPANNFIDNHVHAKLKAIQVNPSELTTDVEFLRRVSFDTIGLPPTAGEVRTFLDNRRPDKRARTIDELVDRPEFADRWALYWLDLLRANESGAVMGRKGVWALSRWLRQTIDRNMPFDEFVCGFITARGSQFENPPAALFRVASGPQMQTEMIAQLFLGTRLECAQCHDHPFDKWTQTDYSETMRFFYQMRKKDGPNYYDEGQTLVEPEKTATVALQFLDGSRVNWPGHRDRREALAEWMRGPARKWMARAAVNRVWGRVFGRGIVDPVDDLRFSNPPVNEPLWDALADDFLAHRYDFKHLVRTILKSRTYQVSSKTNPSNAGDLINFSHARIRRLDAEQLLDALSRATGVQEIFDGVAPHGFRAGEIPLTNTRSYFLKTFGRPQRTGNCTCERSDDPTLPQMLHMLHGTTVMKRLRAEGGTLDALLKSKVTNERMVDELYLHVLSRPATEKERQTGKSYLAGAEDRGQGAEDLLWALVNSRQFLFNH